MIKVVRPRFYACYWNEIEKKDWPKPGEVYICKDTQKRLGSETWIVSIMGDGTFEGDTVQQGIFWRMVNAEIFAQALINGVA